MLNKSKFREIINEHKQMVFNLSIGFLGSKNDAEDLTQDVFIHIFDKYEQL